MVQEELRNGADLMDSIDTLLFLLLRIVLEFFKLIQSIIDLYDFIL